MRHGNHLFWSLNLQYWLSFGLHGVVPAEWSTLSLMNWQSSMQGNWSATKLTLMRALQLPLDMASEAYRLSWYLRVVRRKMLLLVLFPSPHWPLALRNSCESSKHEMPLQQIKLSITLSNLHFLCLRAALCDFCIVKWGCIIYLLNVNIGCTTSSGEFGIHLFHCSYVCALPLCLQLGAESMSELQC